MRAWRHIIGIVGAVAMLTMPLAQAQTLSINDYSYDTVCDFTNRYFIRLKRRIEPKEWDAILQGKGTHTTIKRDDAKLSIITYSHRGLRVKYSLDKKKKPHIWQVDLDQSRISQSLRNKADFVELFKITPGEIMQPVVSMECDGAMLHATIDNRRVTKLSLTIPPSAI